MMQGADVFYGCIYRVIQVERLIFWEVMLLVVVRKEGHEHVSYCERLPR